MTVGAGEAASSLPRVTATASTHAAEALTYEEKERAADQRAPAEATAEPAVLAKGTRALYRDKHSGERLEVTVMQARRAGR